jgi:UDP-N-acetylglucosamine--N-acetylmuramyl-(pentapeptide) pyrophosphoryl-undecaprenol N-acetylglucosamine transferase
MKIGLVGGGSGGHFYPLMAVAKVLNEGEKSPELFYFGPNPYDKAELEALQIKYVYCSAGKLRRYFSIQNLLDIFRTFLGVLQAVIKLYIIYPDVIFSKGGFTSVPVLIAARFLRIPIVIHESDAVPGRANKLFIKSARYIGISYDDAAAFFPAEKTALVGIPLREAVREIVPDPFSVLGIPHDKPLIYVTGGSSGAERVNNIILQSLSILLPDYRIFHQAGAANIDQMRLTAKSLLSKSDMAENYYLEGTVSAPTVSALLSAASLVITRAGSTTLFEVAYHGKPAIVIPIPEDISRDQRSNAYAYARSGAATVIEEQNLTSNLLAQEIKTILTDNQKAEEMSTAAKHTHIDGAAGKIANILLSIGTEHES